MFFEYQLCALNSLSWLQSKNKKKEEGVVIQNKLTDLKVTEASEFQAKEF